MSDAYALTPDELAAWSTPARAVACPICNAPIDAPCVRSRGGERAGHHRARHELATRQRAAQGAERERARIRDEAMRRDGVREQYVTTTSWRRRERVRRHR